MKSLLFLSACGLVLVSAAACAPSVSPTARVALDCPSDVGDLKLASTAPDKKTCVYAGRDGDQVSLRLIPVSTTYEAALQPIEQELQGEEQTDQQVAQAQAAAASADAKTAAAGAKAAGSAAVDAAKAAQQAANDAMGKAQKAQKDDDDDDAKVGVATGSGHGDHANIDLPGIHISADDDGKANVNVGGIDVNAGEDGATVRMNRDVRLRGQALSRERRGFRSTYILAKDNLRDGWKAVGYEAAGPKAGPITVAVFKAHDGDHHDVSDDVKRLVRRNAGI